MPDRRSTRQHQRKRQLARCLKIEKLDQRAMFAANPLGATPYDTGEFLLGSVAVTPVFFESTGEIDTQTQNWSEAEIQAAITKVTEGVNWWSDTLDTLDTVHTLDFVIDETFARDPVETPYEPIDRPSSFFETYVGQFLTDQGYGNAGSLENAAHEFNNDQRLKYDTDWAFTLFMIDSSDDDDGLFASGGSFSAAFAYAGGLFVISPSTRPVSTISHEMGHIFWARDEYPGGGSWLDQRGYYNTQNVNASDNPTPGFTQELSIMRSGFPLTEAYDAHVSPASTLAMVGWQDSDGDGVFDVLDVPLDLQVSGSYDAENQLYRLSGSAAAVPLINQNPSGQQSDITLNEISRVEYRLDGGDWLVAQSPGLQVTEIDLQLSLPPTFGTIEFRVIDASTGITSEVVAGTQTIPALSASTASGYAYLDSNQDSQRQSGEAVLAGTSVIVTQADGTPLFGGDALVADLPDGEIDANSLGGVTLTTDGLTHDTGVGVFELSSTDNRRVYHAFDLQRSRWGSVWSGRNELVAQFDQTVGEVSIEAIGVTAESYVRIEAYDASGELLVRTTSAALLAGESVIQSVSDSHGRIDSVRVFGLGSTRVALRDLQFGFTPAVTTDTAGAWSVSNLSDGNYVVELMPELVIHQFDDPEVVLNVSAGASSLVNASASRVDSPFFNSPAGYDVNDDNNVSVLDALLVINDLSRQSARAIGSTEVLSNYLDVSNDGYVSVLDALLVINHLSRQQSVSGEGEGVVPVPTGGGVFVVHGVILDDIEEQPLTPEMATDSALLVIAAEDAEQVSEINLLEQLKSSDLGHQSLESKQLNLSENTELSGLLTI